MSLVAGNRNSFGLRLWCAGQYIRESLISDVLDRLINFGIWAKLVDINI